MPAGHTESRACKYGEGGCGQYYDCGRCAREKRARAYQRLTYKQRAYDQRVDPMGAYHTDFEDGCSCHISAPCSFCTRDVLSDEQRLGDKP
jgi:hypothetical protein